MKNDSINNVNQIMNDYSPYFNQMVEFSDIDDPNYRYARFFGLGVDEHDKIFLIFKKIDGNIMYLSIDNATNIHFHEDSSFLNNFPLCRIVTRRFMIYPLFMGEQVVDENHL